jgi:hypothetical protein
MWMAAFVGARAFLRSLPWQVWAAVAAVVIVLVVGQRLRSDGVADGRAAATREIEEANDAAKGMADRAGADVDNCYAGGGTWDRARGVCHHGTPRL